MKLERLFRKFDGRCYFCGFDTLFPCRRNHVPNRAPIEHLIPKSQGGGGGVNLVLACARCNHLKGSLSAEVFHLIARTLPYPNEFLTGAAKRAFLAQIESGREAGKQPPACV